MRMRTISAIVVACISLSLVGCGGFGNALSALTGSNPYAGTYAGQWQGSSGDNGSLSNVVVDTGGNVTGTFTSSTGASGSISGTIATQGGFAWAVSFTGGTDNLVGTLIQNGNTLTGTNITEQGLENQTLGITLTLVSNATKKRTGTVPSETTSPVTPQTSKATGNW